MGGIESQLPTILTVVVAAGIDSINPCAIGVLILLLSVILGAKKKLTRMLVLGGLYIFSVFLVYLLAGLGLTLFFTKIPLWVTEYLSITVGGLIVMAGLLEIKDYFWYGRWFSLSIPGLAAKKIHQYSSRTTALGVLFLGAFVSVVELPCTGALYLAIITLLSQYFDWTAFLLLVLYNLVFVAPLIIILILVASGVSLVTVKKWKQVNRAGIRLLIGITLIGLGWMLMLMANGTINLG